MTVAEIALNTLEIELYEYSERPMPLAKSLLNLMINQKDNSPLHSKYTTPLKNFFSKVSKEEYIKQVSNSYTVGRESKRYTQGKELKRLKDQIILDINLSEIKEESPLDTDIKIHKDNLKNIKDFWVLGKIQSKQKDFYSIPLEAKQEVLYLTKVGRQYNNFNRMSQQDRSLTNTPHEIDLSSSVQNIYINQYVLIKNTQNQVKQESFSTYEENITYEDALELFPTHKEYIQNKKAIRERMSTEIIYLTDKEEKELQEKRISLIDIVKKDFTKISFRGYSESELKKRYKNPEFIIAMFKETIALTKLILNEIDTMNDIFPIKKHITIRTENKKIMNELNKLNFRSKLFFYYEYQENKIREAMLEFINNPCTKQVHDAIYTEEEITNKEELIDYIKEKTSFTVML